MQHGPVHSYVSNPFTEAFRAEIDYRCTLLFNNSGELRRLDDFALCIWRLANMNNISLLPCLMNGICDFKKNDRFFVNLGMLGRCQFASNGNGKVDDAARIKPLIFCAGLTPLNRNTPPQSPGWSSLKGYHPSCIATYEQLLPTTDVYVIFGVIFFFQPASP